VEPSALQGPAASFVRRIAHAPYDVAVNAHPQVATSAISAGIGLLSVLGLSFVFPALGSPLALAIGAVAGLALAFRARLPHEAPAFRVALAILVIASAAFVWVVVQPGYIGI
jgi:phage-related minor tail protein